MRQLNDFLNDTVHYRIGMFGDEWRQRALPPTDTALAEYTFGIIREVVHCVELDQNALNKTARRIIDRQIEDAQT